MGGQNTADSRSGAHCTKRTAHDSTAEDQAPNGTPADSNAATSHQPQQELEGPNILQTITKLMPQPLMPIPTPKKKMMLPQTVEETEERLNIRRSSRLAVKQKQIEHKTTEEIGQDVLVKKLGELDPEMELTKDIRNKLEPLPKAAMQAMEELLQAMNIDAGPTKKPNNDVGKGVVKKGK